ncbi:MAG: glycerol-3-phosphate acyltransferase [Dehalococcoidales bacterium]|nr:glycerol-3-phosphate acyltransferase [Dehalococcoidales bacterium]
MIIREILALLIAYLLGAIPFAYIVAHLRSKVDITQVGTRNVGTMNVARELGVVPGFIVLGLDMAKGCLAIFAAKWLGVSLWWLFLTGFVVIIGHSWPIFLKFKGGKGLRPALGVLLALTPLEFSIIFVLILVMFYFTRNSGLSTGVGLAILPLLIWAFGKEIRLILYPPVIGIFTGLRSLVGMKPQAIKESIGTFFKRYPKLKKRN